MKNARHQTVPHNVAYTCRTYANVRIFAQKSATIRFVGDMFDFCGLLACGTLLCSAECEQGFSCTCHVYAVVSKSKEECRQTGSMTVPVRSNADKYLASVVTEETTCGSLGTPWTLRAPPGQTIHIHLLNFRTAARPKADTQQEVPRVCQVWRCVLLSNATMIITVF